MDISSVSTSQISQSGASQEQLVNKVHKEVMEIAEQSVNELIQSVPDPTSQVGQNVDVKV